VRVDERVVDQEGRFCFTIGHELGHWVLHRPQVEADRTAPTLFRDAEPPPAVVCRTGQKKAPAEWQADQFSARLLMPGGLVREAFVSANGGGAVEIDGLETRRADSAVQGRWRDIASAVMLTGRFSNVSNEAMRYRLSDLGLVREPDAMQPSLLK
jgi:Zn-dependent peptidase ImmA (M78 family)